MKQIRRNVFETNSSSTHSLTIVSLEEYEKFVSGELMMECYGDNFISREDAIEYVIKSGGFEDVDMADECEVDDELRNWEYTTYEAFGDDYEQFKERYTSDSGDEIVAFGFFGSDG